LGKAGGKPKLRGRGAHYIRMIAFKIFQVFLLPSFFTPALIVSGLIFLKIKKKAGWVLLVLGVILYYFFSITPVANLVIAPLEGRYKTQDWSVAVQEEIKHIVLLTGGVKSGELSLSSKLSESSLFRTVKAIEAYFELGNEPDFIISGSDPISPSSRPAQEMAKFAQSFGVPQKKIILEEKSKNTYQSAKEVKKIVGEDSFLLVTSAYHLPRSVYIFKKMELNPIPLPADFRVEKEYDVFDFFPQPKNLKKCDLAFHEYFGLIYYRFLN